MLKDVDMILDYKNGIGGEIARAICHYIKASNKYWHGYYETKESTYHDFNINININIMILTTNVDGLYHNHSLMKGLIMLKTCRCLRMILL